VSTVRRRRLFVLLGSVGMALACVISTEGAQISKAAYPSLADIEGVYAVRLVGRIHSIWNGVAATVTQTQSWKIEASGSDQVTITRDDGSAPIEGLYRNGCVISGQMASLLTQDPVPLAEAASGAVLLFSGKPGKVQVAGAVLNYDLVQMYSEATLLSVAGKKTAQPAKASGPDDKWVGDWTPPPTLDDITGAYQVHGEETVSDLYPGGLCSHGPKTTRWRGTQLVWPAGGDWVSAGPGTPIGYYDNGVLIMCPVIDVQIAAPERMRTQDTPRSFSLRLWSFSGKAPFIKVSGITIEYDDWGPDDGGGAIVTTMNGKMLPRQ
jgi:hypothetical protein